jgi:hypothetical protein
MKFAVAVLALAVTAPAALAVRGGPARALRVAAGAESLCADHTPPSRVTHTALGCWRAAPHGHARAC